MLERGERDEVRGKKRKGVGCCAEHGKIDHLACGITYNSSHLCAEPAVCSGEHASTAGRPTKSEERLVPKRLVSCFVLPCTFRSTAVRV